MRRALRPWAKRPRDHNCRMKLHFTKMQGAGNDFVVLDATKAPLALSPVQLRALADRHFGVGADQILVVEPARASLNPHLLEAEQAARAAGAAGAFLGGSGPCMIAIYDRSAGDGQAIASAVREVYSSNGISSDTWITHAGQGCRRL